MNEIIEDLIYGNLYSEYELANLSYNKLREIHSYLNRSSIPMTGDHFDFFCIECGKMSIYKKQGIIKAQGSGF